MEIISFKKALRHGVPAFFSFLFCCNVHSQKIPLPIEWKFKMGDNMLWADQSFDDTDWDKKQVGSSWAATGMKDNVYAWYRIRIKIPISMKMAEKGGGIKLHLGKIDDVDQTFFNGKLVGQTGMLPPGYQSKWDVDRVYMIPDSIVLWGLDNVIAVRVFSLDVGGVGMYQGPYNFGPVEWSDSVAIEQTVAPTGQIGFITTLKFTNKGTSALNLSVKYWIVDEDGKELFKETRPAALLSKIGSITEIAFSNFQPAIEKIFKVGFRVTADNSIDTVTDEQVYLADKNIDIPVGPQPKPVVYNKVTDAFRPTPFDNQILKGYLGLHFNQNLQERLLKIDEDGIMNGYLQRPGIQPWIGEHVGKYLEAACNTWKVTHNTALKKQMDRMMFELIHCQLNNGYLGTYTPDYYWTSWDVWSHKYNLYGLLAYYTTTGYHPALEACIRIGDLLCSTFGNQPGQRNIILSGEHQGMAATSVLDPMVELYRYTGDKRYLDFCYYIIRAWEQKGGPKIINTLLSKGRVNEVANGKAYEMLSNLLGLSKLYRLTGDPKFLKAVIIAWQDIVTNRLYITGTASSFEHFQGDHNLPGAITDNIGEGCVTVTWIQLNQSLLDITGQMKYVEQIEKSVYNQLLGAENPASGCVSYYTPLMGVKPFSCNITCCTSSVPRGIALIPYFTFGNVKSVPTLLLYGPANYNDKFITADGKNINLSLQIESSFPENGNAIVSVNTSQPANFSIALRVPSWSRSFIAVVGGKEYKGNPGQFLVIHRTWKTGDKITISFNIPVMVLKGGRSYPGQIGFQRGPQVLALDSMLNSGFLKEFPLTSGKKLLVGQPKTNDVANKLPLQWIGNQAYALTIIKNKTKRTRQQITLTPFADAGQTGGAIKVWMPLYLSSNNLEQN